MKLSKLIEIAISAERIPVDIAEDLLGYGITEFLAEGLTYSAAVDMIARAEISRSRQKTQDVSFPQK
jgi:hypothetical protein